MNRLMTGAGLAVAAGISVMAALVVVRGEAGRAPAPHGSRHEGTPWWPGPGVDLPLPGDAMVDPSRFPVLPSRAHWTKVLYVDASATAPGDGSPASPFPTIYQALAVAGPGTRVRVGPGRYSKEGPGDFRALVMERDRVWLDADERAVVVPSNQEQRYGLAISANHVVVSGLTLDGFGRSGVAMESERGGPIRGIVLAGLTIRFPPGVQEGDGIAVYARGQGGAPASQGLLVSGVEIEGPGFTGISCSFGPCNDWHIHGTTVIMARSVSTGSGADGIAVESGDNVLVSSSRVTAAPGDGIDMKASRVTIIGSLIHDVGRNGVKLWRGGDVLDTMTVGTAADAAVVFAGAGRYRMINCLVAEHNPDGAASYVLSAGFEEPDGRLDVTIANSVFYLVSGGLFASRHTTLHIVSTLFARVMNENLVTLGRGKGEEPIYVPNDPEAGPRALARLGVGVGVRVAKRPGFVAPDARDYRPTRGRGLLVDQGDPRAACLPPTDWAGRPRTLGSGPDLGPTEVEPR